MRVLVGILALLALSAVAFYVVQTLPPHIEADLKQRSTQALNAANLTFAKVSVTGRVVTLSGEAPGPSARQDAVKVAGDVWGVSSVHDALVVASTGQPVTPQSVISENTATVSTPEPAAPQPAPSSDALPTIGSLVDPALGPPSDAEPPAEPALAPTPEPATTEQPPPEAPTETTTAVAPPPAPAPESAPAPAQPTPTPVQPAPSEVVASAEPPPRPTPTPVQPAPPEVVASAEPPAKPTPAPVQPAPTPAPTLIAPAAPAPPVGPLPKAEIAKGISAGLSAAMQSMQPAIATAPPAYRLEAHVEGSRVEMQGLVSTTSAQRALVAHVRRHMRRANVVDTVKVAHAKPDKDWLGVARTGLAQLARLDTGSLKFDGHSVAVSGKPKSERDRARVLAALSSLPRGYTSTVLLERMQDETPAAPAIASAPPPPAEPVRPAPRQRVVEPPRPRVVGPPRQRMAEPSRPSRTTKKPVVSAYRTVHAPEPVVRSLSSWCRHRFSDVLPRVAVAFESGSSRVESSVGLDEFVRVVRQCPEARIRLTGHSDTQEAAPAATGLSLHRALAVRMELESRGLSDAGITVLGRGGLRPAFSNATVDGRENNRRVEFAVW